MIVVVMVMSVTAVMMSVMMVACVVTAFWLMVCWGVSAVCVIV